MGSHSACTRSQPPYSRNIHTIKPLQPYLTQYEIKTLARVVPDITDDEVDAIRLATDVSVESAWPTLCITREFKDGLKSKETLNLRFPNEITDLHRRS